MSFEGKNILIAGGSSGTGLALVNALSKEGAEIYNVSRTASESWPNGVHHLSLDLTGDLSPASAYIPDPLHGLVYSVGSINLRPFSRISKDDFVKDYILNVVGAAGLIQQSLKQLKNAAGSSIVLISTVAARTGMSYHASIGAAKSGLEGLAFSLAAELAPQQIRVNVIAPSLTDTPMAQQLLGSPEKREASAKRHPLGRFGNPEDISDAIRFLLSDQSSWITGQVLGVDGGLGNLRSM